jgi:hypothetical protein
MRIPKEAISADQPVNLKISKNIKHVSQITNKEIYWTFVRNIQEKPIILDKLRTEFGILDDQWENVFAIPRIMRDTRIKAFQYKILFNLIPCNLYLKRIKKSDTDRCAKCPELDDIVHYFCQCQQLQCFWNSFKQWWNRVNESNISLNAGKILLGIIEDPLKNVLLNACLLLAKWHIYKSKLNDSDIFFYSFLCNLRFHITNEKTIALRNGKLNNHNEIWQKIEDELT